MARKLVVSLKIKQGGNLVNNNIQQVQQRLSTVTQICSQMRQLEQSNAQQLQRLQQLTQECINGLNNVAGLGMQQQFVQTPSWSTAGTFGYQQGGLFDPAINASTYQGVQQTFGSAQGAISGQISTLPTQSSLADPSTMGPDTYQTARYWLGGQAVPQQQSFVSGVGTLGQSGLTGMGTSIGGVNTNLTSSEQQIAGQAIRGFNQ